MLYINTFTSNRLLKKLGMTSMLTFDFRLVYGSQKQMLCSSKGWALHEFLVMIQSVCRFYASSH